MASLPLSSCLVHILKSDLEVEAIVDFLSNLFDSFDDAVKEERVGDLAEALVDVVEALQASQEDAQEAENMEEDGAAKTGSAEDKAMDVLHILVVSSEASYK